MQLGFVRGREVEGEDGEDKRERERDKREGGNIGCSEEKGRRVNMGRIQEREERS